MTRTYDRINTNKRGLKEWYQTSISVSTDSLIKKKLKIMGFIGKTFDLDNMDYEDLRDLEFSIEKEMDEFFDEDEVPYYGDRGYQDLCEDLEEVREAIEKKLKSS